VPFWFVSLSVLAALGALASMSGDLVLVSSIYSFGLLVPVWSVAANLWWVMVVLVPWVWLAYRGRPVWGFGVSLALLVGLAGGLNLYIVQLRDQMVPALPSSPPGSAVASGMPTSLEIRSAGKAETRAHDCDLLCERLLAGPDIKWIRVLPVEGDDAAARSLIYYRADVAACAALDAGFPRDATCLLARPDDGTKAILRIVLTTTGDGFAALRPDHGWVYLTQTRSLTLTDQRGASPAVLDQGTRYLWSEPQVAPLMPGMTALGSGQKFDGLHLPRKHATA
jgi:hypothetical protein